MGTIELAGNEPPVPDEDGVWYGHAGHLLQSLAPESHPEFHHRSSLICKLFEYFWPFGQPIPGFATGGIVTSPTVGLLAEKESEAIVPRRNLAASKAGRGSLKSLRVHQPELKGMQQMSEW